MPCQQNRLADGTPTHLSGSVIVSHFGLLCSSCLQRTMSATDLLHPRCVAQTAQVQLGKRLQAEQRAGRCSACGQECRLSALVSQLLRSQSPGYPLAANSRCPACDMCPAGHATRLATASSAHAGTMLCSLSTTLSS